MSRKFVVKGYKILSKAEETGLRSLFRAVHIKSGQEVFLTLINVRQGPSMEALLRRAELSQKLSNPALVTAIDYGVQPNVGMYYTHRFFHSTPLQQQLDTFLDEEERLYLAIRTFIQLLEIVEYIHLANTTHRDLTTPQVRVDSGGKVYLEGFINARPRVESRNIANMVHLPYIAPEVLMGAGAADKKTDIYSLGVIFFELLTQQLPYDSNYSKIEDARQGVVPSLSAYIKNARADLEVIVMKALAARNARYRDVREWIQDLEEFYAKRSMRLKVKDFSVGLKNLFVLKS